jgi:hypothetical protein
LLSCGGGAASLRGVSSTGADTGIPGVSSIAPATTTGGGATPPAGTQAVAPTVTHASFAITGAEAITLDPLDAAAEVGLQFHRVGGKKVVTVTSVVRAYRLDVPTDRPTVVAIRASFPDTGAIATGDVPATIDAYVTTWPSAASLAPHVYSKVVTSNVAVSLTTSKVTGGDLSTVHVGGSIVLQDSPSGAKITLDKIAIEKHGMAIFPARNGVFAQP